MTWENRFAEILRLRLRMTMQAFLDNLPCGPLLALPPCSWAGTYTTVTFTALRAPLAAYA